MPIGVGAAIVGAAAIGGAATLGSSAIASSAASSAAKANNALESQIYQTNSTNEQPYIQSGDQAETALNGFLGLDGSDAAASQKALNNYLGSTGYQFTLNQGLNAAKSNAASEGLLNSGSTAEALDTYGAGVAQQYGQQYEQDLQGEVNTGVSATNALAGEGENYANAVSSNNNSAASATGNAALVGGSSVNNLIGNALQAFSNSQGASSFTGGASGGSNAFLTGASDMIGG